ncbi:MAG: 4-alpha-glucanotransferase, partial [Sphingobacteriaceae bacterium]
MAGELENLYQLFKDLNLIEEGGVDENIKSAIAEFLIQCPVYRYYGNSFPLKGSEADAVQTILNKIRGRKSALSQAVDILEKTLLIKPQKGDEQYNSKALKFYQRCMQFTGPLMAKGVEDTLMYTYNRFIGHNEVGDSPEAFGFSIEEFHRLMQDRQHNWPLSINGTSTHDTKRGEDVRARLNVLTEISEDWIKAVKQWQFLNKDVSERYGLSANDEYFIYQTIVGALPMPDQGEADFESRIHEYLVKSLREAKQHSDWASPNEEYETAAKNFATTLLNTDKPFHRILQKFNRRIADFGIINSLLQVLLKFTCPGVPDVYQGCELWDLSLVDPDNRRAVDYDKRSEFLENLGSSETEQLWENRYTGRIKLWLTSVLLKARRENSEFFVNADYIPLKVKGKYKEHILAFARKFKGQWFITVVPLHLAKLSKVQKLSLSELKWKNTRIVLPDNAPNEFENLISNTKTQCEKEIFIKDIFSSLPLAVLKLQQPVNDRGAGVLLHITSLPSPFGIGDLGPGAKRFADYLSMARQKYWQILPLTPTEEGQGYSPYSAISSMAGNPLLISPELLAEDGLLEETLLKEYQLKDKSKVDFSSAGQIKNKLLDEAYHNFCSNADKSLHTEFDVFCKKEADWLDDFSLYLALKHYYQGKPWYEWPEEYKLRDSEALEQFSKDYDDQIAKTKWFQFVFMKQWNSLKEYCNKLNIHLFGDLPFYISNDSSDVWANKEIFCLDEDGRMANVAGVPPDYFNDNGQLWGMPLFKWDVLKDRNYDWWVKRIKKNMQLYDLLRLDHFRAFSSYWDVPAQEETARNGEWKPGPGSDLFRVLKQELGELPFVAEDLGDIDQPVFDLRDEFDLPGMRVLQFAFGDDLPKSVHVPHNFNPNSIVYTGTHDNNTTLG